MTSEAPEMPTPEVAFEMYQSLVENNEQAMPMLLFATKDTVVPVAITGVPAGSYQQTMYQIVETLKQNEGSAIWVISSNESWMREVPKEDYESFKPGQMQREHEAGSTEVKECVAIIAVAADGRAWQYTRQFERVGSQVIWGDPLIGDVAGGLPDVLLYAIR